jgi:putative membrane protein
MKLRHWASIAAGALAVCGWSTLASADDQLNDHPDVQQGASTNQPSDVGSPGADTGATDESGGYGETQSDIGKTSSLTQDERQFLDDAAQGNLAEIRLGKLAEQKATNPQVKQFGADLQRDHQKVLDQVKQIGMKVGHPVPSTVDNESRDLEMQLGKLSGAEFDQRFMSEMTDKHQDMIDTFEDAAKDAKNPQVKSFISSTLPSLRQHMAHAEQLENNLSKAGYGGSQGGVQGGSQDGVQGGDQGGTGGYGTDVQGGSSGSSGSDIQGGDDTQGTQPQQGGDMDEESAPETP